MADASIPVNVWLDRPEQIAPDAYAAGYRDALDAAIEAVNMWISYTFPNNNPSWTKQIPAAIDALRKESND